VSGGDDVTVVWVAPEGAAPAGARSGPGDGREDASRALVEWGRARGLRILTATAPGGGSAVRVDPSIADRVEKELDRARDAVSALDADGAERALARAEALLREHPELPQAAWLRAEVHRGWAARFTRIEPRDDQRAQSAWQEADALDGGRSAGIGEVAFPPRPRAPTTFTVSGAPSRRLIVRLDGAELAATTTSDGALGYTLDLAPAEHQLVVTLDGDTIFASWVAIAPAVAGAPRSSIPIHVGDDGACSGASLSGVVREGSGVRAARVTCDHWVAAAPAERRGAVLVARCVRNECGPFLEWRSEGGLTYGPHAPVAPQGAPWPAWATWTAIGVGVLAATTITLVATGVFESRPTEQRFVAGGVRAE
jgi:hypothetical protein